MLIVHISKSPLAGAPIRIVNAINEHTKHEARLINLSSNAYGSRTFPEDLIWNNDKEDCLSLIKKADILHFHHFMDLESNNNDFGVNFKELAPNAKFIMHYHTELDQMHKWLKISPKEIMAVNCQKVVIPHYPERTFLTLPVLPNILAINSDSLKPIIKQNKKIKVAFSSSSTISRYDLRWNTKGYKEVSAKLRKLSDKLGFEYVEIINMPYEKAIKLKSESDIVIGDIVTGSYHLTELEGLSQGKVVFSYLDARSVQTFMNTFKTKDVPFVNISLDYIEPALKEVIENKQLRQELGDFSRNWMEKHYDDKLLIQEFINIYNKVLNDDLCKRKSSDEFQLAKTFLYNDIFDLKWTKNKHDFEKYKMKNIYKNIFSLKKTKDKKYRILTVLGFKFKFIL